MKQRPKPISLRPMSREMRAWRLAFIISFIGAVGFGWYVTVGKAIGNGVKGASAQITKTISTTKDTMMKNTNSVIPEFKGAKELNDQFQQSIDTVKTEVVKDDIYQNVASQIKYGQEKK